MSGAKVIDPFGNDLADAFNQAAAAKEQPLANITPFGAADQAMAEIITAQKVAIKRNMAEIANEFRDLCTVAGGAFFYRWEVNDKASPTGKSVVEGPSIDLAMALVGVYGNCRISATPARETPTHIVFAARFIDYEKGVTVERTFQQRKNQSLGMADKDRSADIVYQIGQSKAMRNAVVAALKTLADQGVEWSKQGIIQRVAKNPEGARGWLVEKLAAMGIPIANAEYIVAGKRDEWTPVQMARLFATIQSITDGYSTVADEFPAPGARVVDADEPENVSNQDLEGQKKTDPPQTEKAGRKPRETKKAEKTAGPLAGDQNASATDQTQDGGPGTDPDPPSDTDKTPPAVGGVKNDAPGETGSQAGEGQTASPAAPSAAAEKPKQADAFDDLDKGFS